MPIVLLLQRFTSFWKSKETKQATTDFRKQIDYLVWAILFMVGCTIIYSVGSLIYSMWK